MIKLNKMEQNEYNAFIVAVVPSLLPGTYHFRDFFTNRVKIQNRQAESWGQQVEQWAADTKADKEIGGDKLTVSVGHAQKALDTFASKEFREFLDSTGLGNHPEMVRAFAKVGKLMSEDSFVTGQGNGSPKNDLVEAFYPSKK